MNTLFDVETSANPAVPVQANFEVIDKRLLSPALEIPALEIDWKAARFFKKTVAADSAFTFANDWDGAEIKVLVIQDGTGGWNVTFPGTIKWPSATFPGASSSAGDEDVWVFCRIGSTIYGQKLGALMG